MAKQILLCIVRAGNFPHHNAVHSEAILFPNLEIMSPHCVFA
jgi:hypothetical protein